MTSAVAARRTDGIGGRLPRLRGALPAGLIAIAALAPLAFSPGGDVMDTMVLAAAYVVMALGLNVIVGFAGLLDLGYVAFYAIGAYMAAYFASGYWGIHVDFLLVLVVAAAAAAAAGALIGVPTLRLRGDYIAVVTLAFGEIVGQIAANGRDIALFGGSLTAGPAGIGPIDKIDLPLLGGFGTFDLRPWYWFALALVVAVLVISARLRDSRIGRAWIALRDDEGAAAAAGIPVARAKLRAYATGAALGGVSGAFLASYLAVVNADQFQFSFSIFVFSMVVLGGMGSIPGVVLGAIVLSVTNNYLLPDVLYGLPGTVGLDFDLSAITSGIYGAIVVVTMLLRPEGVLPARRPDGEPDRTGVQKPQFGSGGLRYLWQKSNRSGQTRREAGTQSQRSRRMRDGSAADLEVDRTVLLHGGFPDMKSIRRVVLVVMVVAVALALVAGPAAAKAPKGQFAYYAVIDCGSGPVEVGSGVDLWSTLVDVETGKKYKPVAWHVSGEGFSVDETKRGEPKKHAVDCSYSDGVATGTVTVKKA